MKDWKSYGIGVATGLTTWMLQEFYGDIKMAKHVISFLITFSPVIIGFFAVCIYWVIADYLKFRKEVKTNANINVVLDKITKKLEALEQKIKFYGDLKQLLDDIKGQNLLIIKDPSKQID